jgi:hypothetical protein
VLSDDGISCPVENAIASIAVTDEFGIEVRSEGSCPYYRLCISSAREMLITRCFVDADAVLNFGGKTDAVLEVTLQALI